MVTFASKISITQSLHLSISSAYTCQTINYKPTMLASPTFPFFHPLLSFLPFILSFILLHSPPAASQDYICGHAYNFTANSNYQTNLNTLLSALTNNTPTSGFSNATTGQVPDQVYGIAMCRGDVNASTCRSCLQTADRDAPQLCAYDKGATIWYDYCLMRHSNQYFLSSFDNSAQIWAWNAGNATDVTRFNQLKDALMNATANYAAYNSTKKFATGVIGSYTVDSPAMYGLVQCTPDMSGDQCRQCLQSLFEEISMSQLNGKQGGKMTGVRCNFRYDLYSFEGAPTLRLAAAPAAPPAQAPTLFQAPPPPAPALVPPAVRSSGQYYKNY